MKIGILSRDPKLYSTRRLVEAAEARGHDVQVIDVLKCYMNITANQPSVHYKKQILNFDAVIPRIGASVTSYGTAVLRQFEVSGVISVNESISISRSRDKLRAHQLLARKGVGMPITGYAHSADATDELIDFVGGAPLIVKLMESTHGEGIVLAETKKAAEGVINAFRGLNANFLVQEYIKEANGSDIRCFVVGDRVVASMQRTAKEGDFRSNLHRGGTAKQIKLTAEERAIALKAAKVMGLDIAGVDIIQSERGPLVLEVNSSPGLQGIESITSKDVADKIIEFAEKHYQKGQKSSESRGKG
jgi:ribosomal protein S6--L-glutamate ligase